MSRSFIMLLVLVIFLGAGFGGSFIGGVFYGQTLEDETSELSPRLGAAGQFPGGGPGAGAAPGQRGQGRQGQGGGIAGGQTAGEQQQALQSTGQGGAFGRQGRPGQAGAEAAAQPGGGEGDQTEGQPAQSQPASEPEGRQRDRTAQPVDSPGGNAAAGAQTGAGAGSPAAQATPSMAGEASGGGGSVAASGRGGLVGTVSSLEGDTLTLISARGESTAMLSDSTAVYRITESSRDSLTSEALVRVIGAISQEGGLAAQSVIIMPAGTEDLLGAAGGPGGRRRVGGP